MQTQLFIAIHTQTVNKYVFNATVNIYGNQAFLLINSLTSVKNSKIKVIPIIIVAKKIILKAKKQIRKTRLKILVKIKNQNSDLNCLFETRVATTIICTP